MSDEVETMLAGLERRLRALQSELDEPEPAPAPRRRRAPHPSLEPAPGPAPRPPVADADALERFGTELRRLVAAFDLVLAEARGLPAGEGILFRGDVALDVATDLRGLCELDAALGGIEGVASVDLRAYAGGRAALDLRLDRSVPLVGELRRTLRISMSVVEAREGRLAIEVGRVGSGGPESGE